MVRKRRSGDSTKAIGYIRVSTEEQNNGPDAQRAALVTWAKRNGVTIVATFEDRVSGATALADRPGLGQALAALRDHDAGMLVAAKRDRIARDVVLAAAIERAVEVAGAQIRTADGVTDSAGPEGRMMRGIVDVFASYERDLIRSRTRAALAAKSAKGERVGTVPYGHQVAADGVHLEPNAAEQSVIAIVCEMAAAGSSQRKIASDLADRGVMSRAGTPFAQPQIARILAASKAAA